jgi:hypothetical protein
LLFDSTLTTGYEHRRRVTPTSSSRAALPARHPYRLRKPGGGGTDISRDGDGNPSVPAPGQNVRCGQTIAAVDDPELITVPPLRLGSPPTTQADIDKGRYRPLTGGVTVLADLDGAWFGTMGCLLTHTTDNTKVYGLTSYHILSPVVGGPAPVLNITRLGQPDAQSSPTKCCSNLIGTFAGGGADQARDAALIQLDPG